MKFGYRTPSISKSFKARTTGRANRITKRAVNPLYGKKGMGWINNPKKAAYNRVYNRTTRSMFDSSGSGSITEMLEVLTIKLKEYVKPYKDAVKNKDYAGYCEVADKQLLGFTGTAFKWLSTIVLLPLLPMLWLISKIPTDAMIVYTSRYYCDIYKRIFHSKAFKVFAVIAVVSNPYLLLIVVPAYGIYRLRRKNHKAPVTTESKEEDQKQVEYTEVKSIDDIQL